MAEEDEILDDIEGEGAGKKKPMGMIIGIIVGLLVLGGGGYSPILPFFRKNPLKRPLRKVRGLPKKRVKKRPT